MQNPSFYTNNAVFQLSLSSKELFHSNFLYWLATDSTLNPHKKGSSSLTQNFFNQLLYQLGSSLANKFNLDDYAVFREYEHFDFSIWEKKVKSTKSGGNDTDSAQNENVVGEERFEDNKDEQNDNASKEVSYEGTCDTKELERVVLVLENKFKSIPYQEQLDFYAGKVLRINHPKTFSRISNKLYKTKKAKTSQQAITEIFQEYKKGCNNGCTKICKHLINFIGCEFFLLTLAQNFPARRSVEAGGLWTIVNYSNYSNILFNSNKPAGLNAFTSGLIDNYYYFIHNFSDDINKDISSINNSTQSDDVFKGYLFKPYRSIRMHDIWQKLVMSKLVFDIETAFKNANTGINIKLFSEDEKIFMNNPNSALPAQDIYIGTGYGSSGAYLEIKYKIDQNHAFIVQIQNNCYRRGILYDKSCGIPFSWSNLPAPSGTNTLDDFFVQYTPPQKTSITYGFGFKYPKGRKGSGTFLIINKYTYKFNSFGANTNARIYFLYQYVIFDKATIGQIIATIVSDISMVIQMYP